MKGKTIRVSESDRSRKEVIQPHLPVRLPCYDLAPVTCSTLTGFYYEHQLQVYQTSMA
jgi:hypothetical protein